MNINSKDIIKNLNEQINSFISKEEYEKINPLKEEIRFLTKNDISIDKEEFNLMMSKFDHEQRLKFYYNILNDDTFSSSMDIFSGLGFSNLGQIYLEDGILKSRNDGSSKMVNPETIKMSTFESDDEYMNLKSILRDLAKLNANAFGLYIEDVYQDLVRRLGKK